MANLTKVRDAKLKGLQVRIVEHLSQPAAETRGIFFASGTRRDNNMGEARKMVTQICPNMLRELRDLLGDEAAYEVVFGLMCMPKDELIEFRQQMETLLRPPAAVH